MLVFSLDFKFNALKFCCVFTKFWLVFGRQIRQRKAKIGSRFFKFGDKSFVFRRIFSKIATLNLKEKNMPKDANGTELNAGDNVTLVKDLKVKAPALR